MSNLYDFIKLLPVDEVGRDFVRKSISARDLVLQLPAPENYERVVDDIPDIPVTLFLSTTKKLPRFIKEVIRKSKDKEIFGDESLSGLCLNGRGMPIRIFLHDVMMMNHDPSGRYFEEVLWHEYVHGAEGIFQNEQGEWKRVEPWSYGLQQKMIEGDCEQGFDPFKRFEGTQKLKTLLKYYREGTELQENVSEIFARAACAYMITIRETKQAPYFGDCSIFALEKTPDFSTPLNRNLCEFFEGVNLYSPRSQNNMFEETPMMMARIHMMYGCKIPD